MNGAEDAENNVIRSITAVQAVHAAQEAWRCSTAGRHSVLGVMVIGALILLLAAPGTALSFGNPAAEPGGPAHLADTGPVQTPPAAPPTTPSLGVVQETYFPVNGSFIAGNTQPPQNYQPEGVVLLPSNVLFVSFGFTSGYEFLNATTGEILADWWPGYAFDSTTQAAYDPDNGLVYMTNGASRGILVVNTTTRQNAGWINASYKVGPIAYDPANGLLYAGTDGGGCGGGTLQVIDPTNATVVANITLVANVMGIVYDPAAQAVAIADSTGYSYCSTTKGYIELFNGTSSTPAFNVSTGNATSAIAYDGATGALVAAGAGEVWAYNSTTGNYLRNSTLSGFPPGGLVPGLLYVNQTGDLYASDTGSLSFQVLNGTNYSVVASQTEWPPFGGGISYSYPVLDQLAYVPSTGTVELASGIFDALYRFNVSTNAFVHPFMVEFAPTALALDTSASNVLVGGFDPDPGSSLNPDLGTGGDELLNASSLSTVSPLNLTLMPYPYGCAAYDGGLSAFAECALTLVGDPNGTVTLPSVTWGSSITGMVWDPHDSQLWASDSQDPRAYYMNDSNTSTGGSLKTGTGANGIAYDAASNEILLLAGGRVLGYGATNHTLLFNVSVGGTLANPVFDEANDTLFFTNSSSSGRYLVGWNVSTHKPKFTVAIPFGSDSAVVPAPSEGEVYVLASASNQVLAVSLATHQLIGRIPVGTQPVAAVFVASTDRLWVANAGSESISIIGPPVYYTVRFNETGLPSGTAWSVSINGTSVPANGSTVATALTNGTYSYSVGTVSGYRSTPTSGTLVVNGSAVTVGIRYARLFAVNFTESGLPTGTAWSVVLNGSRSSSSSATITFRTVNGSYPYRVDNITGWVAQPKQGNLSVAGADLQVPIAWAQPTSNVTFEESGLPAGTSWGVSVGATTHRSTLPTIDFNLTDATYQYSVLDVPGWNTSRPTGSFTLQGQPILIQVNWTRVQYTVTFQQSGLPSGTSWGVDLNGSLENGSGAAIGFLVPNGTYPFEVLNVPGWRASAYAGTAIVNGNDSRVSVEWTQVTYAVTFTEQGLPTGTDWSVTVGGVRNASMGTALAFHAPNATGIPFSVGSIAQYTALPSSGSFDVTGNDTRLTIAFSPSTAPPVIESIVATPAAPAVNTSMTLYVNVSGGAVPLRFTYTGLPAGCQSADQASLSCTPREAGNFSVNVSVQDNLGRSAQNSTTVVVSAGHSTSHPPPNPSPTAPSPTVLGLPATLGYLVLAAIGVAVAGAVTAVLVRRRRRGGTEEDSAEPDARAEDGPEGGGSPASAPEGQLD